MMVMAGVAVSCSRWQRLLKTNLTKEQSPPLGPHLCRGLDGGRGGFSFGLSLVLNLDMSPSGESLNKSIR